ncbi:aminotransferase class V-fold PLP-dependent enzyme [Ferrimicrobium acidiphilum]|uniref:Putative cysteine desulfurase n=1 Tax=Ferrimicrobium acidiphilum DSM 19497 TaxID=1121877 RepID=A0A0D8FVZ5_9ACTN|nr:aminotransferase class V-fold PLP-dependent enzyme [Ferrimicrobium acidiphilum]KJE77124.1 putative cysteine desulfurase [Ferrimicrobium acidiphilum DSM 19497]
MKTASTSHDATQTQNRPHLELVGDDIQVPLVQGGQRRYINLDFAASTPALVEVAAKLDEFLPYYSSVHRGAGIKSQISTSAYEGARETLRAFFGALPTDTIVITRNTTDSMNLLASCLPVGAKVVAFTSEHHTTLLPWQRSKGSVHYLTMPKSASQAVEQLSDYLRGQPDTTLVAVTGASNVTGEIWPIAELATVAHQYGARIVVDAAQMAPHLAIDMTALDVDYLAASGHKLYAPYGAGVLLGRADWLDSAEAYLRGGGAVDFVTPTEVLWSRGASRHEAGSPNVIGAVAMAAACETLAAYGMDELAEEEIALADYARRRLADVPGIELYRLWEPEAARIGVVPFNLAAYDHSHLAAILSAEFGIGVRHGCFCAHPLILELLNVSDEQATSLREEIKTGNRPRLPGAVRMSIGVSTTRDDLDYLVNSLTKIANEGPSWTYAIDPNTGEFTPAPDPREWPDLPITLDRTT